MFPESMQGLKLEGDLRAVAEDLGRTRPVSSAKSKSFAKVVAEAKGKIKDARQLKAELPIIGKQCAGCHETYRVKS